MRMKYSFLFFRESDKLLPLKHKGLHFFEVLIPILSQSGGLLLQHGRLARLEQSGQIYLCLLLFCPFVEVSSCALYTLCCTCKVHTNHIIPANKFGLEYLKIKVALILENFRIFFCFLDSNK